MMRGYFSILSVFVLTALITAALYASSSQALFARLTEIRELAKIHNILIVDSCAFIGIEHFAQNPEFALATETISVGSSTCVIDPLTIATDSVSISVHSVLQGVYTRAFGTITLRPDGNLLFKQLQNAYVPP